jgi:hypothetical protein
VRVADKDGGRHRTASGLVYAVLWDEGTGGAAQTEQGARPRSKVGRVLRLLVRLWFLFLVVVRSAWAVVFLLRGDYANAGPNLLLALVFGGAFYLDVWLRLRKNPRWPYRPRNRLKSRDAPQNIE